MSQVSTNTNNVKATWIAALPQWYLASIGVTNSVQPYWRFATQAMQMTPMVNCVQGFDNTERVGLPGLEFVFTSPPSTSDRSLAATPSARHLGERCSGETQSRERYRRARARSRTCPLEWASSLFGLPAADWNHVIAYLTSDISYTSNFFLVNPQQISSVTVIVS